MNVLLDIGHPAQVHLFKNFYRALRAEGHEVYVYARDKDCTLSLLEAYDIPIVGCTRSRGTLLWNMLELVIRDFDIWRYLRKHRIDVALGTSFSIAHTSRLCPVKTLFFGESDVDVVPLLGRLAYPFCTAIVAPSCVRMGRWKRKHIPYEGYQKLAYLHPNWFTPDPDIVRQCGLDPETPYFVIRVTAFNAYHDGGHRGLDREKLAALIEALDARGKVVISSERPLSEEFERYRMTFPHHHMHHVLAFATAFVGDSQSMATESACLGVPAYRCNSFAHRLSVLDEIENRYGLIHSFEPAQFNDMLALIRSRLANENLKEESMAKRDRLLADKIDVTPWMVDFVKSQVEGEKEGG